MNERSVDYDGDLAASYEAGREISEAAAATWRSATDHYLGRGQTVLDVGAGTGRFARLIAGDQAAQVVAIEPATGMRAARRSDERQGISWAAGTAEQLPVRDRAADVVWTAFTAHYLDLPRAAPEFARVLHTGGHALVWSAFPEVFDDIEWYRWFPAARSVDERRTPTIDDVCTAFDAAGFSLVQRSLHRMLIADSLQALADRLAHRSISSLRLIEDHEFDAGLRALRHHAGGADARPVHAPNVLLVFRSL